MMSEIPPVQSMEAVDLHLRLILSKIDEIQLRQNEMVTKAEFAAEIQRLNTKIDSGSVQTTWKRVTEIAVGVVAMCTAIGFVVAVVKFLRV